MYPLANAQASVPTGRSSSRGDNSGAIVGAKWNFCWPDCLGAGAGEAGFEGKAPGPAVEVAVDSAGFPDEGSLTALRFLLRSSSASNVVDSLPSAWHRMSTHSLVGLNNCP